ncbi:MAG TPA: cohesin domain-containing protein [Terriglobales bacterium]|nr:cohesin domain-containing protein [Terriglobales bacterium]
MRRLVSGLLLVLLFILPAAADKASSLYNKGKEAEVRQKYEEAYDLFRQAYDLKPRDARYRMALTRSRFEAAAALVKRGQALRDEGKLPEALALFEKATETDPGLFAARQEAQRTREMIQRGQAPKGSAIPAISDRVANAAQPAQLKPISSQPITLRMTEDTKNIYTTIGKLAGVNVLFDPDYVSRRITIELNNVSLHQALETVALISRTFWRPVTSNTVLVGADTKAKRNELEQSVIKTFYMNNLSQSTELQDVVNTLRTVLEITRVLPLPSQGAIVVRGSPDQIALAEKLINDIDKAKSEVIVDVAVMQVRRDKVRNLGISPPTSANVQLQPNVTTSTTSTTTGTTSTTGTTGTTSTPGSVTLNKLSSLNANDFQVTIPGASLAFLANDSTTKVIQQPQIRVLDGQKATLKIGDRVPVATGSFQPGVGGVGINPLVNTQFQYIDVGVNIDVTPNVHMNGEVTLKVVLEVSSVTNRVNIGGIDQPVIGQRRMEHQIRLKEGEVNLIGGILEDQDVTSLQGWPFLSKVPILRYFFSQENKEKVENEIVFALVPHMVRGPDVSDLNQRALDVGTANSIDLRQAEPPVVAVPTPAPAPAPAAAPATAPPSARLPQPVPIPTAPVTSQPAASPAGATTVQPQTPAAAAPVAAPQMPQANVPQAASPAIPGERSSGAQPAGALGAGGAIYGFDPPQVQQANGSTFALNVVLSNAQNVHSTPLTINYDPALLQMVNISNGGFLGKDSQPVALVHREDPPGTLQLTASRPPGAEGMSGEGAVFTLTFMARKSGQTTVSITRAGARDSKMQAIPASGSQALITVK